MMPPVQDFLSELITPRDRLALDYLTNITVKGLGSSSSIITAQPVVEFHFKGNPYFSNSVLRRGLPSRQEGDEEEDAGIAEVATDIKWKEGHDLTVKVSTLKRAASLYLRLARSRTVPSSSGSGVMSEWVHSITAAAVRVCWQSADQLT
jgi:hypothetical protein